MRTVFGTGVLMIVTGFFAWTSWMSFRFSRQFGERLGLVIRGFDGLNEIRAQYGGFFLAAALINALALLGTCSRQTSFVVNAVVFGGLITGRVASLVIDGGLNGYSGVIRGLFFIDTLGFTMTTVAYLLERSSGPAT